MNTKARSFLQRGLSMFVLGACLSLVSVADAEAHKNGYRSYVVHRHYAYSQPAAFPFWLREKREFQRWYLKNRFRLKQNISWQRRYEIFVYEKPFRLQNKRLRGRVIYHPRYRTYWNHPKPRW